MKSKTSCFNATIFKKNITHYWPIWLVYLGYLMAVLPINIWLRTTTKTYYESMTAAARQYSIIGGVLSSAISPEPVFVFSAAAALAVFCYLYTAKNANMIHSLPVNRLELYVTNYLSGFLFLFVPEVIAFVSAVLVCLAVTYLRPGQLSMRREEMTWAWEIVRHAKLAGMVGLDPALMGDTRLDLRFTGYDGYMLAVLANYGWLGLALIQAPAAAILIFGWRKLHRQASLLGRLLGTAALATLTWQAAAVLIQNLVGLRGLLTCFPYPFLSDGGTALAVDCALLGLLLSIFRGESIARDTAVPVPQMPKKETV